MLSLNALPELSVIPAASTVSRLVSLIVTAPVSPAATVYVSVRVVVPFDPAHVAETPESPSRQTVLSVPDVKPLTVLSNVRVST